MRRVSTSRREHGSRHPRLEDGPAPRSHRARRLTTICAGDPLISCYAGDGNQDGLTFIHGWTDENGTPAVPAIRDVSVLNRRASDLSAPYFLRTGDCELGAEAVIDFGVGHPAFNPQAGIAKLIARRDVSGSGLQHGLHGSAPGEPDESIWRTSQSATLRRRPSDGPPFRSGSRPRSRPAATPANVHRRRPPVRGGAGRPQGNQVRRPRVGPSSTSITTLDPPWYLRTPTPETRAFHRRTRPNPSFIVTVGLRNAASQSRSRYCRRSSSASRAPPAARTRRSTATSTSTSRQRSRTAARRRMRSTTTIGARPRTAPTNGQTSSATATGSAIYPRTRSSTTRLRPAWQLKRVTRSDSFGKVSRSASRPRPAGRTTGRKTRRPPGAGRGRGCS